MTSAAARFVLATLGLALLGGCAAPAGPPVGPSVLAVEATRFQVTYHGPSRMPVNEVRDRALLQAAKLTLDHGYDWFQVAGKAVAGAPPTTPQVSFGIGGFSFGRHSGVGAEAGTTVGGEGSFVASLEVVFGKGARPRGADAYDAHDVAANLGQRLH